jgi:predicted RNase H-like HicB family nuclease
MPSYIALIEENTSSGYGAFFPDFPGCVTVANSLSELRVMAEEVLAFHIEGMVEDGDAVPSPTSLDDVLKSEDYKHAVAILVVNAPDIAQIKATAAARRLAALGGSEPGPKAAPRRRPSRFTNP